MDTLVKDGRIIASSRVDLARSLIAAVVRAGTPKPDISTVDAFKRTLENAKSIAYSDSASGVYIENVLYKQLGVSPAVKAKSKMIPADPVGEIVARGEAELGFQQLSELLPVEGIAILGPIPTEIQKVTLYAAGVAAGAKEPEAAAALIKFLSAPAALQPSRRRVWSPAAPTRNLRAFRTGSRAYSPHHAPDQKAETERDRDRRDRPRPQ